MLKVDINLIFTVVNVLILFAAVRIFLWKPIHKILDQRQAMVDAELAAAEQAKTDAQALQAQRQAELEGVEAEKARALEESTTRATEVYDQIVAEANKDARDILKKAERDAEREKQAVLREAQTEIRDLVLEATAKVVGVRAGAGDDSALYDQFLEKVGGSDDDSNA